MTTSTAESIENTINQAFDDILERHPDITDKQSKTSPVFGNRAILLNIITLGGMYNG